MKMAILVSTICLSGCTTLGVAVDKGADAADSAVKASIFTICNGASVGSIRREFGARPDVWRELCADGFIFEGE